MSIEEAKVIDIISTAKDGSSVTLTATDHLEWDGKDHLLMIQEKINREDHEENIFVGFVVIVHARSCAGFHP